MDGYQRSIWKYIASSPPFTRTTCPSVCTTALLYSAAFGRCYLPLRVLYRRAIFIAV